MGGYLVNFSVYTFAMIGFLFIAVAVYKKTYANTKCSGKNGGMEIEESLSLSPRKRLHVVRVNDEKFLIAADVERTEFLAKLDSNDSVITKPDFRETLINLNKHPKLISSNNKIADITSKLNKQKETVFEVQGNNALKNNVEIIKSQKPTILSQVNTKAVKKPPMMREILRKLEAVQG